MGKWSQVALLVGWAVGCLAIWSSAAPVGLTGDLVTGSWTFIDQELAYLGCTGSYCVERMDATGHTFNCSVGGPYTCSGGVFLGAQYKAGGYTLHANYDVPAPCSYSGGDPVASWSCHRIREATFN